MFHEWLARTGDARVAAERAGVSERTARRWKRAAPAEPQRAPPPPGVASGPIAPPTRFFGRRDVALRKLFADGARIVTVLGPAGIGKTRLALRWAELAAGAYDAVFFCDLSDATTVEHVSAIVARTLGVAETEPNAIGWALEARGRVLLVLDNFEGAVAAAPATAGAWSAAARRAHVVATSRVRLRLAGEACLVLEPLSVPPPAAPDPMSFEAVQLLVDRARLAGSAVAWDEADLAAAAEITRRLDGNALALELAGARLALLSPRALLTRLARRFEVLVGGARGAAARQASMRVALDGSWELLNEREREALADASAFAGAFGLEAAEGVVGDDALALLERLHQASLVHTRRGPTGDVRFALYETIREYAREKAAALGRARAARDRHMHHFASTGHDGAVDPEELLAALRHALATRARGPALALAARAPALFGGHAPREVALLDEVLAAFGPLRAGAYEPLFALACARADAARRAGDADASVAELRRVLRLARRAPRIEALAELGIGNAHHAAGRSGDALASFARARALARRLRDRALEGRVLARTAMALRIRQDTARALAAGEAALSIFERVGSKRELAEILGTLATLHQRTGELERARARYEEAAALVEDGDPDVAGPFHGNRGTFYNQLGELDAARKSFERAHEIFARAGIRRLEAVSLGNLASVDFESGRLDDARRKLETTVRVLRQVGDATHEAFFSGQLAAVLATMGAVDDAEALLRRVGATPERATWADALALQQGFVELARAAALEAEGDEDGARSLRDAVRARIAGAPRDAVDDVRVAVRMLSRALERPSRTRARSPSPELGVLTVTADVGTVWLPSTERVSLAKRGAVRAVLRRLIDAHAKGEGTLTVEALLAAGWPGERVLHDAGASRVYVALATLRKLGLRGHLQSRDGGYALDPALRVKVLEVSEP